MFPRYLQYLLTDFRQTFVTGASWDTDDLITFLGQKVSSRSHHRGGGAQHSTLPSSATFSSQSYHYAVYVIHIRTRVAQKVTSCNNQATQYSYFRGHWICRTGKWRTKRNFRAWIMQDWKRMDKSAVLEFAGLENEGQKCSRQKMWDT